MHAGRRARERAGAERGITRALRTQPPVAGEPPGAGDEHTDADPFALGVPQPLDPSVLRCHELVALDDDPRVRILRSRPDRRIDRGCTESTHSAARSPLAALA